MFSNWCTLIALWALALVLITSWPLSISYLALTLLALLASLTNTANFHRCYYDSVCYSNCSENNMVNKSNYSLASY